MSHKPLKRIKTKDKNYVLGDVLGEGAFGQVREGMRVDQTGNEFGRRVAVKIISRRLIKKVRNGNENLKKEIRCIKLVKHPNVIKLLDTVDEEDSDKVYLIFELANFLSLQDLCDWVKDHGIRDPTTQEDKKCLPFPHVRLLLKQLLQGLQACHSKGVVHRDIKPSNLQLNSDFKLKIIDFGVAETLDRYQEVDTTERFAGTPSFQPPEVANGQRSFCATKVDIWAAGVTLYYMVEGKLPFSGSTLEELYTHIGRGEFSMPQRAETDKQLQELLKGLLNVNPDERWTLEDTLDHPFCDTSDLDDQINLSEVADVVKKKDEANSLMRRYMTEEEANSDDETNTVITAEEDTDPLDVAREARASGHHRPEDLGAEKDEVVKRNDEIKRQRVRDVAQLVTGSSQCVIS